MNVKHQLANLDNREFYGLALSAAVLVIVLLVSFVLLPQIKKYQTELKVHATLPLVPEAATNMQQVMSQKDGEITEKAKLLHGDMANLPLREVEAFIIDRVQGIAWNHDVDLRGVKPQGGEDIDSFHEVLFKLEVSGHYLNLFSWLHELKRELGFVVIKEYEMKRASEADLDPLLNVKLTIASYRKVKL